MDKTKNILIIQSYNPNKGDNSVAEIMISSLKKYGYNIMLTAFDPVKAEKEYHIKAFDYLLNFRQMKFASSKAVFLWYALKEALYFVYSFLWLFFYKINVCLPLPHNKKGIIKAYKSADLIVLPGGHFFTSFNSLVNNFSHYYGLRYAQLLGKKTMVYSQTVGPYNNGIIGKLERILADRVLKRADLVTLRENDSLKNYFGKNVVVTAETVFIVPVPFIEMNIAKYIPQYAGEPIIGITIHHIYYKHYFSKEEYVKLMAEILDAILSQYDCRILMIPMEDNCKAGGDRPIIKEMMWMVKAECRNRISMVTDDLSSPETANIISRCTVFVGTKTHSIVYGLKTATPTLSISYQEKSTEFMKMFGLEENAIAMSKLNQTDFMAIFNRIYLNKEAIRNKLQSTYSQVRKKAEYNNVLLNQLLDVQ